MPRRSMRHRTFALDCTRCGKEKLRHGPEAGILYQRLTQYDGELCFPCYITDVTLTEALDLFHRDRDALSQPVIQGEEAIDVDELREETKLLFLEKERKEREKYESLCYSTDDEDDPTNALILKAEYGREAFWCNAEYEHDGEALGGAAGDEHENEALADAYEDGSDGDVPQAELADQAENVIQADLADEDGEMLDFEEHDRVEQTSHAAAEEDQIHEIIQDAEANQVDETAKDAEDDKVEKVHQDTEAKQVDETSNIVEDDKVEKVHQDAEDDKTDPSIQSPGAGQFAHAEQTASAHEPKSTPEADAPQKAEDTTPNTYQPDEIQVYLMRTRAFVTTFEAGTFQSSLVAREAASIARDFERQSRRILEQFEDLQEIQRKPRRLDDEERSILSRGDDV